MKSLATAFTLWLGLLPACMSNPPLGTTDATGVAVGMVRTDVGWTAGFLPDSQLDEGPEDCAALMVGYGGVTISVTRAAVESTGSVPLTADTQIADAPSVTIIWNADYLPATPYTTGTFTLTRVNGALSATVDIGGEPDFLPQTITDAPYCP